MDKHFEVDRGIFDCFAGMHLVVAVVEGLDNRAARPQVSDFWLEAWNGVAGIGVDDARAHTNVAAWRRDFAAMGVSMKRFPTSVEALLRRALKGGDWFSINPLVDFYNALSLKHVCPAGAFDLDALSAPVTLRFTSNQDRYTALDANESSAVTEGEIAYASGHSVLTRHFMWRQARLALVDAGSRNIFLVSEIPGVAGAAGAERMRSAMVDGLRTLFGCECQSFTLHGQCTSIVWN